MAKTNAQRQADYRRRRYSDSGKTVSLDGQMARWLMRIAQVHGETQTAALKRILDAEMDRVFADPVLRERFELLRGNETLSRNDLPPALPVPEVAFSDLPDEVKA